jgi:hypothetical protein
VEVDAEVVGERGPFARARYTLRQTRAGVTLSVGRTYYGEFREDSGLSLLGPGQLLALREALGRCGSLDDLAALPPPPEAQGDEVGAAAYWVRWRSGAEEGERVSGRGQGGAREGVECVVRVMQRAAEAYLDPLPFDMAFVTRAEAGYIDVMTRPPASILVDGVPVAEPTPLWHHPVVAGVRVITILNADLGFEQSFELRVERGGTTALEVDLLR